jgi:hypothetical protein
VSKIDTKPKREAGNRSTEAAATLPYFIGSSQASVTALSMRCRSTLLHLGQLKVRKSWPNALGSIAVSFIGELQAMQHGPWFCESSIGRSPIYAIREGCLSSALATDLNTIARMLFALLPFRCDRTPCNQRCVDRNPKDRA